LARGKAWSGSGLAKDWRSLGNDEKGNGQQQQQKMEELRKNWTARIKHMGIVNNGKANGFLGIWY
jgi:hypothetical protein